ncbi:mCG144922, isoform CRA_b, partial [Mus musculus]
LLSLLFKSTKFLWLKNNNNNNNLVCSCCWIFTRLSAPSHTNILGVCPGSRALIQKCNFLNWQLQGKHWRETPGFNFSLGDYTHQPTWDDCQQLLRCSFPHRPGNASSGKPGNCFLVTTVTLHMPRLEP